MGKKTDNENVTVVDLRKKSKQQPVTEQGKQGAIAIDPNASHNSINTPAPVASNEPKKPRLISRLIKRLRRLSRTTIIVIIGLVILTVAASGLQIFREQNNNKLDCSKDACKQLLTRAATAFEQSKIDDQKKVVDDITHTIGYEKQPNYLYVTTMYYINISDTTNARKNYDKFMDVYDPKAGLSPALGNYTQSPDQLKSSVEFLEQKQTYDKANQGGVAPE